MKKILILIFLVNIILLPVFSSGGKDNQEQAEVQMMPEDPLRIALLNGPSGIGLIQLKTEHPFSSDAAQDVVVDVEVLASPKVLLGQMLKEEWDMAVLPSSMAALLHNKGIAYQAAAVTGLGNLYLLSSKGADYKSLADFVGKTLHVPGKNTTPDLVLQLLAEEEKLSLNLDYSFNPADLAKALAGGVVEAAVLPEPLASIALKSGKDLEIALDIQVLWKESFQEDRDFPLTVLVVKESFALDYPQLVEELLISTQKSLDWVSSHPADASKLISEAGFTLPPPIVAQAIPRSNYVYLEGAEAQSILDAYYKRLYDLNPAVIGAAIPGDQFYY